MKIKNNKSLGIELRRSMVSALMATTVFLFAVQSVSGNPIDTDGDGISDTLDELPNQKSGVVITLNETDAALTHTGNISTEYPNLSFAQAEVIGQHGKVKIFTDGRYEYVANESHDAMNMNSEKEEIFTFTSEQNSKFQFVVTIVGTNDAAVISKLEYNIEATLVDQVEQASGYLRVKDKDSNEASFVAQSNIQGTYGQFSINTQGVWSYVSEASHHTLAVGSSLTDAFTVSSKDGTHGNVSITIQGSKNPDETVANGISHHVIPDNGQLVLRDEITIDGPYFSELDGWGRNSATVQRLFKLDAGQRYQFRMQGISLKDPRLQIMGPIDESQTFSVLKQPEKGTVTINSVTGSWVYSSNEGETENDPSTVHIGIASQTPVLVPAGYDFWNKTERTQIGTANTATEYKIDIGEHSIVFKVSENGTANGNGASSTNLDPDMSFEIVGDLDDGATPTANYDKSYPRLYLHVASNGTSTVAEVASAINNEPSGMFFDAVATKVEEISGRPIKITFQRMNPNKSGGIFGRWIAGNDDGDYMGDDAQLFITPQTSGYYLLGCIGDAGGNDFGVGTFELIAEKVTANTFGGDRSLLVNVEESGDLVKPVSKREVWEDQTISEGEVDSDTVDFNIVTASELKNFKGVLNHDADVDYVKVNLDIEKWYSFEVGGDVYDPQIQLLNSSFDEMSGNQDGGEGLNGLVKFKPSAAGVYYLAISSDAPTYWGQGEPIGTGEYVVKVKRGEIGQYGHWLTSAGAPAPYGTVPAQDVPSGTENAATSILSDKITGSIEVDGDRDWFKYTLEQGKIYRWTLNAITLKKPSIRLRNSGGELLDKDGVTVTDENDPDIVQDLVTVANSDGTPRTRASIVFVAGYTGDYYVEVFSNQDVDPQNADTATGTFNLEAVEHTDDFGGYIIYPRIPGMDDGGSGFFSNYVPESYDFSEAGYLQAGRRTSGDFYSVNDVDFFGVDLLNRNTYSFKIFPTTPPVGDTFAQITLYDSTGNLVDGSLGFSSDGSHIAFDNVTPPVDGYYYLKASAENDFSDQKGYTIWSTFFGDDYSSNRQTNGLLTEDKFVTGNIEANGDEDWIRVDLEADQRYEFKLESGPYGAWMKLKGTVQNGNLYVQRLLKGGGTAESAYSADIGANPTEAHKLSGFNSDNLTGMGGLIPYGDKDWIAVDLEEGQVYQFYVVGAPTNINPALSDPKFNLYNSVGQLISVANNNAGVSEAHTGILGKDAELLFTAPQSGTYYLEVEAETTAPKGAVIANGAFVDGVTSITVDPIPEYFAAGTTLVFSNGGKFTLTSDALVTHTTLSGTLSGNITDDEAAFASWIIPSQSAVSGATTLSVNSTARKLFKNETVVFSNGSTFKITQEAEAESTQLTGVLAGDVDESVAGYRVKTGRYSVAVALLPTEVVAQHYHGILSANEVKIDWTPRYTAPYFINVGTHWGDKGEYKISMKKLAAPSSQDLIGETKDTAVSLGLGVQTTATMEYGGDRDWYKVELIPGESYRIDLAGDGGQSFDRQNPIIKIFDEYGKPKGELWKWQYDRKWGKPGGAWSEAQNTSYVWSVPLNRFDYPISSPSPTAKIFYLEASSNTAGDMVFTLTHLLDDQSENMTTTGVLAVGGTASGTWEMGVEDGANEDLLWGTNGGDGDWFKTELVAGNTYKIDIFSHHFNRPSVKLYTEAGVYFRDNQKHPNGDHDPSVFIETIKNGHAQMTFTSNRTGVFFINAWNTHTWDPEKGGSGNNIYDLSLVHIPDDIKSSIETSSVLPVGGQASATLNAINDRDWFKVTLKKGAVYRFNLEGNSLKDPSLRIRDSHGKQLLYNDHINGWWNPKITYTANEDGVYYVDVAGIDTGAYTIKCVNVYTPPEGDASFVGAEVEIPTDVATEFLNNAQGHTIGNIAQGSIEIQGDRRWYKIDLKQARAYEFHQFGDSLQSPSLFLRDKNGSPVFPCPKRDEKRSSGEKVVLTYECSKTDVYYLDAGGFWSSGYQQNGQVAGVPTGSFSLQTFDLGTATERALSWDTTFAAASGSAPDLVIGAQETTGQLENAVKRDLFKISLVQGAAYRFRIQGALINGDVDRGVKSRLFLHDNDGEYLVGTTVEDLHYEAPKTDTYYIAVGATTGQLTGSDFRQNGVPYEYKLKLIQKRAPKTEPSVNWFAELSDIANDILAAAVSESSDKKLDRAELLAILNNIKAGGITQGELTDLRILVANYKDVGLSNYLVTILDNLANGDPANQYYTGRDENNSGKTSRQDLGNLYPGSSEDRVEKLISKWFLGTDSPASPKLYVRLDLPLFFPTPKVAKNVQVDGGTISPGSTGNIVMDLDSDAKAGDLFIGETSGEWVEVTSDMAAGTGITVPVNNTGTVAITNSSKFTVKGARASDVNQGKLGDCYLLSSLSAVAESNIGSIDGTQASVYPGDMFVDNGDGTFGVRWYDNSGLERWVTVDRYVPGYRSEKLQNVHTSSGESWTMLAEKAYVQLNESDNIGQDGTNRYGIGNNFGIAGGSAHMALSHVTGQKSSYKYISSGASDSGLTEAQLIEMINKKLPMVFSTSAPCQLASHYGVKRKHTYTYESYDVATQKFFLRNPWGNTHAEVTFAGLKHMGSNLAYLDGTREKMQRINPSDNVFSVSDAASSPGSNGGETGLTAIESNGSVKLFKDDQSKLYAGSDAGSSLPLMVNDQILTVTMNGRTAVAVEAINGVNKLLWKDDATNALEAMGFNSVWQFVSAGVTSNVATDEFYAHEVAFAFDADSDSSVGNPNSQNQPNTAPVATAQSVSGDEDSVLQVTLAGTDNDGDTLTYTVTDQPAHGTLSGTAPTLTYTPNANYSGADSFTFKANDGTADSSSATVNITVNEINDVPVADAGQAQTVDEGTTVTLDGSNSSDADTGDTLTYAWAAPAEITLSDATAVSPTFTAPDVGQATDYTLTLVVNDGQADSDAATVVVAVNDVAPVAPTSVAPSGSGTDSDPYLIASLDNLYWLSQTSAEWGSGKHFVQTTDIDASTTSLLDSGAGFTPIGNSSTKFYGNYDGGGHVISGLFIDRPTETNVSFIGYGMGQISNLGLENVNITGKGSTAGFIAWGSGVTINKCYVTGTVKGNGDGVGGFMNRSNGTVTISNCYSTASVTGTNGAVGGFLGYGTNASATISNCYSTGSVSAGWMYAGFAGFTGPTYHNSFWDTETSGQTNGQYQGELAGVTGLTTTQMQTASTFTDAGRNQSVNEGETVTLYSGWLPSDWNIVDGSYPTLNFGDSSGNIYSWASSDDAISLSDATAKNPTFTAPDVNPGTPVDKTFTLTLGDGAGGTQTITSVVTVNHVNSTPAFSSAAVTEAEPGASYTFAVTTTDADSDVVAITGDTLPSWLAVTDHGDGTATLSGTPSGSDLGIVNVVLAANDGTSDSSNNSATLSFSIMVSKHPAGSGTDSDPYLISTMGELYWLSQTSSEWVRGKHYKQTADIDASATSTLDNGAGFTPLGSTSTNFRANYDGGGHVISGLFINRPTESHVGFIGYGTGQISNLGLENVDITGKGTTAGFIAWGSGVTINKCYVTGTVKGNGDGVGGFMNRSNGTVTISNCYSTASVTGTNGAVGGFLGYGTNASATISNCYSTGSVSAGWMYAGFAGFTGPTYHNSFWDTETSGQTNGQYQGELAGVTGLTTTQMQTASTFTDAGWSTAVWNLADGSYPTLTPPTPPNTAPVANAGSAQTVDEGTTVTLDGSASSDADTGDTLTYAWTAPAGITLSDASLAKPTFTAPAVGQATDYSFSLVVNDGQADSSTATVVVTVNPVDDTPPTIAIAALGAGPLANPLVSSFVGNGGGFSDGAGSAALFNQPSGVAVDSQGNIYVGDHKNHRIRKITPQGSVTTLAGGGKGYADGSGSIAKFDGPFGVAVDLNGNVYVADVSNHRIRKISPAGDVSTLAGGGQGYADGTGTAAKFDTPFDVAVDSSGNVYVGDYGNNRIRKISPAGDVTTLAGSGTAGYVDDNGIAASFRSPLGVAVDGSGNVYVADLGNQRIRKITAPGDVTTLAGGGNGDGLGAAASFSSPFDVETDDAGNVYVADTGGQKIRKITPAGEVTTIAGTGTVGSDNGDGSAASFNNPKGVAVDDEGNIYVADSFNHRIRKITTVGETALASGFTTSNTSISVTFTLSETSTDFDVSDVTVTNGTLSNFAGSGDAYTATLSPSAGGEVTLNINADVFSDAASNGNLAATQYSFTYSVPNEAPTDIALASLVIAENQAAGTVVGDFSTTDADQGDTHVYTLVSGVGDADNARFTIDGATLKTGEAFDYENQTTHLIRVQADDQNGGLIEKAFTITITDDATDNPQVVSYGWEDGGVHLGKSGNLKSAANVGVENGITPREGSSMLRLTGDSVSGNAPEAYLVWITGLSEGDTVSASFWVHGQRDNNDDSSGRVWGGYTSSSRISSQSQGSASGNSTYAGDEGDWEQLTYTWTIASGKEALNIKARVYAGSATTETIYIDDFEVTVSNPNATVHLPPANQAPLANAGQAQTVDEGTTVTLDGSASSDADTGDTLTYAWTAPAEITLSDATAVSPTFTAPDVGQATDYTLTLVVNDGQADSAAATVVVTVNPVNASPSFQLPTYALGGYTWSNDMDRMSKWRGASSGMTIDIYYKESEVGTVNGAPENTAIKAFGIADMGTADANFFDDVDWGLFSSERARSYGATKAGSILDQFGAKIDLSVWNAENTQPMFHFTAPRTGGRIAHWFGEGGSVDDSWELVYDRAIGGPWIVLNGAKMIAVNQGETFNDPGVSAFDEGDVDLTSSVVTSSDVNEQTPGLYTVTYNVTDGDGLVAEQMSRNVAVIMSDDTSGYPVTLYEWSSSANRVGRWLASDVGLVMDFYYEKSESDLGTPGAMKKIVMVDPGSLGLSTKDDYDWSKLENGQGRTYGGPGGNSGFDVMVMGDSNPDFHFNKSPNQASGAIMLPGGVFHSVTWVKLSDSEVEAQNAVPVANAGQAQTVDEGTTVTLDGSASSDADAGDTLTYAWTAPAEITLSDASLAKPTFTAPAVGQATDYTFSLVVNDGQADSSPATVVVTVNDVPPANTPPVAVADSYSVDAGAVLNVPAATGLLSNDSDADQDSLSADISDQPSSGSVTVHGVGSFTYTPNDGFSGVDTFTYKSIDGNGGVTVGTVKITVNNVSPVLYGVTSDHSVKFVFEALSHSDAATYGDPSGNVGKVWTIHHDGTNKTGLTLENGFVFPPQYGTPVQSGLNFPEVDFTIEWNGDNNGASSNYILSGSNLQTLIDQGVGAVASGELRGDLPNYTTIGTYTIKVLEVNVPVDNTAPDEPSLTGPTLTNNASPTFTGTAEAGSTVNLLQGGRSLGQAVANENGAYSISVLEALAEGSHDIVSTATDGAGNESGSSATHTVEIDLTPPTITLNVSSPHVIQTGRGFDVNAPVASAADDGRNVDLMNRVTLTGNDGFTTQSPGNYTFVYSVTDDAGNSASAELVINVLEQFTIQATVSTVGGSVSPAGYVNVFQGASQVFAITADSGYSVEDVTVDGVSQGAIANYTFSNISDDHQIDVTFSEVTPADTTPPVITLSQTGPVTLTVGDSFTAPGASAVDNVDGDVSGNVVVDASAVDTSQAGTYSVTYNVSDVAGNDAVAVTLQVVVSANSLGTAVVTYPYVPMTILAKLSHQNYTAVEGDTVKAYVGNELRAKGTVQLESGVPVVSLLVNVNAAVSAGESLSTVLVENSNNDQYQFVNKTKLVSGTTIGNNGRYLLTDGISQALSFDQGWNFVSMFVNRGGDASMSPSAYFDANYSKIEEIRTYSGVYNPSDPLNGVLSTLTKFEIGSGYWVRTSSAFDNTVSGYLGGDLSVQLESGWNMAGYPRRERRAVADIVGSLKSSGKLVQVISDTELYLTDDSLAHFNTLTHFDPGKGYWVKMNDSATWDLNMPELVTQSGNGRSVSKSDGGAILAQFKRNLTTYPNVPAVLFSTIKTPDGKVTEGSIVGAFVDDELRGVQVVRTQPNLNTVSMVVHLSDKETVSFRLWDSASKTWKSIREKHELESGDFLGANGERLTLTLETKRLAKALTITRETMRLQIPRELQQSHKLQRSFDLRTWQDVEYTQEELEDGVRVTPNRSQEFFRLINR